MSSFVTHELGFDLPAGSWEDHTANVLTYPNGLRITLVRRASQPRPLVDVAADYVAELRRAVPGYELSKTDTAPVAGLEAVSFSYRHAEASAMRWAHVSVVSTKRRILILGVSGPEQHKILVDEVHRSMCASLRLRNGGPT